MVKKIEPSPERGDIANGRLESWQEIADYLKRDKRTVQRWEKEEGLPIHRHRRRVRSSVFAFGDELEEWLRGNPVTIDPITARSSRRRLYFSLGLCFLSLLIGALGIYVFSFHPVFSPADTSKLPRTVTDFQGQELQPAISPGGNQVAFVWGGESGDNLDIYVQSLTDSRVIRRTTAPEVDYSPAWSPDGASIAVLRGLAGNRAEIILVPVLSGAERVVGTVTVPPWEWGPQLSWSSDGHWIAFGDGGDSGEALFGISLINVITGERRPLSIPEGSQIGDHSPVFSPDGESVVFTRALTLNSSDLYRMELSKDLQPVDEAKRLTSFHAPMVRGWWSACGKQILAAVGSAGKSRLWRVPAKGDGSVELNPVADQGICCPVLLPDHRLIYSRRSVRSRVRSYRSGTQIANDPLVVSSGSLSALAYSGSKDAVAFASDRFGHDELWLQSLSSSGLTRLTQFGKGWIGHAGWSPDGARIVFDSSAPGHSDIFTVSVDVPSPQGLAEGKWLKRITQDTHEDILPTWSRDGKHIYFSSNRAGGFQIWKVAAEGGEPVAVTKDGGLFGMECPDSCCLYFTKWNTAGLWKLELESGDELLVAPSCSKHFAVSSDGILCTAEDGNGRPEFSIQLYRFSTGQVETLQHYRTQFGGDFDVSYDGNSILISELGVSEADLLIIDHFHCRLSGGICERLLPWLGSLLGL
ncbi:MAG: PD40 domain-containing protein [Acidobacteriota bacterium]|nr:MAG: PD40 domain-containing protein [Acidobacteriota bacterium]